MNEISDVFLGSLKNAESNYEVFVKENVGDICKIILYETKKEDQLLYTYEKRPFYSSSDEVLFVYSGEAKLGQKFDNSKISNISFTFFFKKNGAIIQTPHNSTSEIINYYKI